MAFLYLYYDFFFFYSSPRLAFYPTSSLHNVANAGTGICAVCFPASGEQD
ncbi:hypothetical protein CGRA01v4_07333 [Colletotrichum graminicola]|nr:hypothetical protein CGRA01v4_07333 [Colletotrichum graminicola]